jgi:hypothetical protein
MWQDSGAAGDLGIEVPDLGQNIRSTDFLRTTIPPVDVILGGPPFVRLQKFLESNPEVVGAYRGMFRAAQDGQFDLYMLFFEKAISVLKDGGWLGWSVSNTFLRSRSGRTTRQMISAQCSIRELVEFEARKVYPDALIQIVLAIVQKGQRKLPCRHVWVRGQRNSLSALKNLHTDGQSQIESDLLPPENFRNSNWMLHSPRHGAPLFLMSSAGRPMEEYGVRIASGVVTGADTIFLVRQIERTNDRQTLVRVRRGAQVLIESAILRPIVRNRDVYGYGVPSSHTWCITPHDHFGHQLNEDQLRSEYPLAFEYLSGQRAQLESRHARGPAWYGLRSLGSPHHTGMARVLLKRITAGGDSTLDVEGKFLCHNSLLILTFPRENAEAFAMLAIFNSRVFWTFLEGTMPTMGPDRVLRVQRLLQYPIIEKLVSPESIAARTLGRWARQLLAGTLCSADRAAVMRSIDEFVAEGYGVPIMDLANFRRPSRGRPAYSSLPG